MLSRKHPYFRNHKGAMVAELPVAIWLLVIMFTLPMIDFATILIRYTFMVTAAQEAVHVASRTKSFLSNISGSEVSAVNGASAQATLAAASFKEITITKITTRILITNLSTKQVSSQTVPLAQPADTGLNLYQIETVLTGQINPIFKFNNTGILPGIPGLSAPVPVSVAARAVCEFPQGLNQ